MTPKWKVFDKPVPFKEYGLPVGTQIRVRYPGGTVEKPKVFEEEFLIGDINSLGGVCDDCYFLRGAEDQAVVLAERVLATEEELDDLELSSETQIN